MSLQQDPQKLLEQAKLMRERVQDEITKVRVEASTGGGMVTVRMDGNKRVLGIVIEPDAVEDIEMLQDMVRGAVNEAVRRAEAEGQQRVDRIMGGLVGRLGFPFSLAGG